MGSNNGCNDLFFISKDGKPQNHVSFPELPLNGSAKQFANGTNEIVMTNDTITITNHHPPPQPPPNNINRKKSKRKYSQSLSKYRRLEIGNEASDQFTSSFLYFSLGLLSYCRFSDGV